MRFVLVHGAFHGGWCWADVVDELHQRGHEAIAPTLPGLAERSALLAADLSLSDTVDDLVSVLRRDDLRDVVLVGHSFGGAVITGVADLAADRLQSLVYLDGAILESGETMLDVFPEASAAKRIAAAMEHDRGLSMPVPSASFLGVQDRVRMNWVEARMTPHPLRTYQTALDLKNPAGNSLPTSYIICTNPLFQDLEISRARAAKRGWPIFKLNTGHDAMILDPQATTDRVLEAAIGSLPASD